MSVPQIPPSGPPAAPPLPPQRPQGLGWFLAALLIIVGIVLLLPGLCSLVFMGMLGGGGGGVIGLLWAVSLLIGVGGIILIQYAIKNR